MGKLLAIEVGENCMRGAVVSNSGRSIVIHDVAEVKDIYCSPDNNFGLDSLLSELSSYPKKAVIVNADISCVVADIPSASATVKDSEFRQVISWEAEPYLHFPVSDGLFGYRKLRGNSQSLPVMISAISKDTYELYKKACARKNISLRAMYSAESSFLFSYLSKENERVAFLYVSEDHVIGAVLDRTGPISYQTVPNGSPAELLEILRNNNRDISKVIVAGIANKNIIDDIGKIFAGKVLLWSPQACIERCKVKTQRDVSPAFATVIGMALQEYKRYKDVRLAVSDRIDFVTYVKKHVDMIPLVVVVLFLCVFLGHYAYMQYSCTRIDKKITKMNAAKKELNSQLQKRRDVRSQLNDMDGKLNYLKNDLPKRMATLISFLKGVSEKIPSSVIINDISQMGNDSFSIEGLSVSASTITGFVRELEQLDITDSIKIKEINEIKSPDVFAFSHRFTLIIKMKVVL